VLEAAPDVILVVDRSGKIVHCNQAVQDILGYTAEELLGQSVEVLVPKPYRKAHVAQRAGFETRPHRLRMTERPSLLATTKSGEHIPVEITLGPVAETGMNVAVLRDMRPRLAAAAIQRQAEEIGTAVVAPRDPLTDLHSRTGMERAVVDCLARGPVMAGLLNVRHFRRLNDAHGYATGDRVLCGIAHALVNTMRSEDYLGRVSGDEFVMLMPNTRHAQALRATNRCLENIRSLSWPTLDGPLTVEVSVAVGLVEPRHHDLRELMRDLGPAMSRSRAQGTATVAGTVDQSESMLKAVSQAIVDVQTGEVVSSEMLARGEVAGMSLPGALVQVEPNRDVPNWLDLACLDACIEEAGARSKVHAHVNLFPTTLLSMPIADLVARFPAGCEWVVELSEHLFVGSPVMLRERVKVIRDAGLKIAIDDLGFGRSSLEALITLSPDLVKIDRHLVTGVKHDHERRAHLKRLLKMLEPLEVDIVAEGVETQDDLVVLQDFGVRLAQGYLWGLPA
jgi:diguanylate cyclase